MFHLLSFYKLYYTILFCCKHKYNFVNFQIILLKIIMPGKFFASLLLFHGFFGGDAELLFVTL